LEDRDQDAKGVASLDVSEVLRIELQGHNYHFKRATFLADKIYYHSGGQSGHAIKVLNTIEEKQDYATMLENRRNILLNMFAQFR
jgi:hypothetical protein